jgi:hypothetical protein
MLLYIPQLIERPEVLIPFPVRPKCSDNRDDFRRDTAAFPSDILFELIRSVAEGKRSLPVGVPQGGRALACTA